MLLITSMLFLVAAPLPLPVANMPCPSSTGRAFQTASERTVARFLTMYLRKTHEGLIDSRELQRIAPYLSRRLRATFANTIKYQQDFIKAHPDETNPNGGPPVIYKPPFVEGGDYFTSLSEWPDGVQGRGDERLRFDVAQSNMNSATANVCVHFAYDTRPIVAWNDTYVVINEGNAWVIDDVIYSGAPWYYREGRLSELLSQR
ncbi:MAG TPA: hypothetical protein VF219_17055 [Vicinamibacterales bacterium]